MPGRDEFRPAFRQFVQMPAEAGERADVRDARVTRMRNLPASVISGTLAEPLDRPEAAAERGDAVEVVARLKESRRCRCARTAAWR